MDVAIVGGGITGLSLALNLFNRGIALPFEDLDKYITRGELRALSENYKRVAGFSLADVPVR